MTRRLRIVIASAVVLVGLLLIVVLSFIGVTHTGFGQERVRRMVGTMLEGQVKGKVYLGHMSGGFFNGVTIDSVEIRDDEDSVFIASGPIRVEYDPRDLFDRRILLSRLQFHSPFSCCRRWTTGRLASRWLSRMRRSNKSRGSYSTRIGPDAKNSESSSSRISTESIVTPLKKPPLMWPM